MKKIYLIIWITITNLAVCHTQVIGNEDNTISMQTKISPDNQYLKITYCYPGSLEDISGLKVGDRIYLIDDKKVSEMEDPNSHIQKATGKFVKLTINRFGRTDFFNLNVPRISTNINFNTFFTEGILYAATCRGYINTNELLMELLYDDSKDLFKYKTYDFELTSAEEPLQERILFNKLESQLNEIGLKRSQENPDLLILISFFSGAKEQYIPPKQIISTRIKNTYNWYWGVVPVPITESTSVEGYTKVTYFTTLSLKFLDANEIERSKTPPVIWSGSLSRNSNLKLQLTEYCSYFFKLLLYQFPEVWRQNSTCYYPHPYPYLGLVYNLNDMRTVGDVIPGSPAEMSGIQKGDQILSIKGLSFPDKLKKYNSGLSYSNGLSYLLIFNTFYTPTPPKDTLIEFKIKRDGRSMIIGIKPELKFVYLSPQTSFYTDSFDHK